MALERRNRQAGWVDAVTATLGGPRTWALPEYTNPGAGRRPLDAVMMLKCVLLAKWFSLGDAALEEMLQDRLSFRRPRKVGLSIDDATPDETRFVRFRGRLREAGLDQVLFDRALSQLNDRGLILQQGTIVDATILEAPRGTKKTVVEDDGTTTVTSTRDQDASFTHKHGRSYHGFKLHIATDTRGLIKTLIADTAKVHDSRHFEALIQDEMRGVDSWGNPSGGEVFADSAYPSQKHAALLAARGVHDGTIKRRVRGQKELPWRASDAGNDFYAVLLTPVVKVLCEYMGVVKSHGGEAVWLVEGKPFANGGPTGPVGVGGVVGTFVEVACGVGWGSGEVWDVGVEEWPVDAEGHGPGQRACDFLLEGVGEGGACTDELEVVGWQDGVGRLLWAGGVGDVKGQRGAQGVELEVEVAGVWVGLEEHLDAGVIADHGLRLGMSCENVLVVDVESAEEADVVVEQPRGGDGSVAGAVGMEGVDACEV